VEGTGAAVDGDEDAITGMIFAVSVFAGDNVEKPAWYDTVVSWTRASISAFFTYNTDAVTVADRRLVKLGSCWGGWGSSGNNPSYHSPGSYRLMREFFLSYGNVATTNPGYPEYTRDDFDTLIDTSYDVLFGVQCASQGMVPNWARIVVVAGSDGTGSTITSDGGSFSGSGTPQYEFGSEASRTVWRVALDAAVAVTSAGIDSTHKASAFLQPLLGRLELGYRPDSGAFPMHFDAGAFDTCRADNTSADIFVFSGGWLYNPFMYGPIVSSLIVPMTSSSSSSAVAQQQEMVDAAGSAMASPSNLPSNYYSRSWTLLANLALNGALVGAASAAAVAAAEVAAMEAART